MGLQQLFRRTRKEVSPRALEISQEIQEMESAPKECLPDPECTCRFCEHYCALFAELDDIQGKYQPKRSKKTPLKTKLDAQINLIREREFPAASKVISRHGIMGDTRTLVDSQGQWLAEVGSTLAGKVYRVRREEP